MIKTEDKEYEKFFFENFPDIAIPFEMREKDGKIEITSFNKTLDFAKEFEEKFSLNPFSDEALLFIDTKLRPFMKKIGYSPDESVDSYLINYEAKKVNFNKILPSTQMITTKTKFDYDADKISVDLEEDEVAFATIIDGTLVSICSLNTKEEKSEFTEINVQTVKEYEKRGYGSSNVLKMCEHLLKLGHRVLYVAQKSNIASQKTAEKCGLEKIGKEYYYICYKEEENGI